MTEQVVGPVEILRTRDFVGWEVVDHAGEKVGTVADLLIDRTGRIRFVDLEYGLPRKHLLLPEHQLEWGEQRFIVGRWTRDQIRTLPPYEPDVPLTAPALDDYRRAYPWLYDPAARDWPAPAAGSARVVPMSEAREFRLAPGAPDLRGWNVFGADGERLGTVSQLLVDPTVLKIRYLDVDLLDDLFALRDDRHVLVPLEFVDLKERGNDIWVQRLRADQVARFPAYTGGTVEPWLEEAVARAFA